MEKKYTKVQVGKIDLDTVTAAWILGVSRESKVEVLKSGKATEEDLANPEILCIEVGGSGRVIEGNFDHHDSGIMETATLQAWHRAYPTLVGRAEKEEVAEYADDLDSVGVDGLRRISRKQNKFPTLSDIFAGMLLSIRESAEQLYLGIEILNRVVVEGIDPFGIMPAKKISEWAAYAKAKADNNRQIRKAVEKVHFATTISGKKLAWLETDFFGAPGACYGVGAKVVVAFSPHFGPDRVPKFTVAGNDVRVDAVLPELNAREPGWGGPSTGTILGSPREGSKLTLAEVVEIVKNL